MHTEKRNKIVLIAILVLGLIAAGWFWNNSAVCGPKAKGWNYDVSYCDASCITDDDCKLTCGCGAVNRDEACHDEGIVYDCAFSGYKAKCENKKCAVAEEK